MTKPTAMGKNHRYQRSSSGTPFGSTQRKKSFGQRNASSSFHQQQREPSYFNERRDSRFGYGHQGHYPSPPLCQPYDSWRSHSGGFIPNCESPPPINITPPAMAYDFPPPQHFYPPMPYATDRRVGGFGGPFRRSTRFEPQEFQDRLFLEEYRYPGPHQAYQPPHVDALVQTPLEMPWRGENPSEMIEQPLAQKVQLRGDAPEFVPRWKAAVNEEPAPKPKDCWFVVSST